MSYKKINDYLGWFVFLIATTVYVLTLEETTSLWDCGEYITTANKLEVGHPPGAPFFMMMGRLFSAFASPENAAYMVNMVSALSSSFSILFLFWTLTMLAKKIATQGGKELTTGSMIAVLGSGAVGALAYTFTDSFWFSAVEGEVYAMSSFFTAIVFWAILKWEVEIDKYRTSLEEKMPFHGSPNRWIIFIAYMIGLSIGVHLLNLLAIPAIAFVIYFKKYDFDIKSFIIAGIAGVGTLGLVQAVIIPQAPSLADKFERFFSTSLGLPFNTGMIIFFLLIIGLTVYGLKWTTKKGLPVWNMVILSFAVLLIGYSSFTMIVVRSQANTPLDENNPESLSSLVSYLNRDQYGSWPILAGPYWNSPKYGCGNDDNLDEPKEAYMKVFAMQIPAFRAEIPASKQQDVKKILSPLSLNEMYLPSGNKMTVSMVEGEKTFMNRFENDVFLTKVDDANAQLAQIQAGFKIAPKGESVKKYVNTYAHRPKGEPKFQDDYVVMFPRMYRQGSGAGYKIWSDYKGDKNRGLPRKGMGGADDIINQKMVEMNPGVSKFYRHHQYNALISLASDEARLPADARKSFLQFAEDMKKSPEGLYLPTKGENFSYMVNYQMGWMYFRYFLWNFAGRQNDTQGYGPSGGGSAILEGNWLSGIDAIDSQRLGTQENLPSYMSDNAGYNKYYFLPLILGLIGFFFQIVKSPKDWFVILLLFLLTGLAIVFYLNQKPNEPRERDYAYAASFYAFAIWIGLGVYALYDAAKNLDLKKLGIIGGYTIGAGLLILGFESATSDTLVVSYSVLFMGVVALLAHALMFGIGRLNNDVMAATVATALGFAVPFILASEGWDDHDRSNRTTARDFAYNYLMSCDENAILFTNGDNDTFPLWYIQEVEGVRTDVRVANMSLLSTDWHINQMKRKAYESEALPIEINEFDYRQGKRDVIFVVENPQKKGKQYTAKDAIDFIMDDNNLRSFEEYGFCNPEAYLDFRSVSIPVNKENALKYGIVSPEDAHKMEDTLTWSISGAAMYKADLAVLDMLVNYEWDRPIYFASLGGIGANKGLMKYMDSEGMTYKLTPIQNNGRRSNTSKMYDLIMNQHTLKIGDEVRDNVGFRWGNMKGDGVLVDYYTLRMVSNLRMQMVQLTNTMLQEAKAMTDPAQRDAHYAKISDIINKVFEEMPVKDNQVQPDEFAFMLCKNLYAAGDIENADRIGKDLAKCETERLNYFISLTKDDLARVDQDLTNIRAVIKIEELQSGNAQKIQAQKTMVDQIMRGVALKTEEDAPHFMKVWKEWGSCMNNLEMIREASVSAKLRAEGMADNKMKEEIYATDEGFNYFTELGILEGTNFHDICSSAKKVFLKYGVALSKAAGSVNRAKWYDGDRNYPPAYVTLWGGMDMQVSYLNALISQ